VSGTGLSDLVIAQRVVEATGRINAGLVLDTWRFFRGAGTLRMLSSPRAARRKG